MKKTQKTNPLKSTIDPSINRRNPISLLILFFLAFLISLLLIPGGFTNPETEYGDVMVYQGSEHKLPALQLTFFFANFSTISLGIYIFYFFCIHKKKLKTISFLLWILSAILVIITMAGTQGKFMYSSGTNYITIGDYLRDVHGLNVFFMDMSGWEIRLFWGEALFQTSLVFLSLRTLIGYLFNRYQPLR